MSERLKGWQLLDARDNEAARIEFVQAVAADPENSDALIGLGKALARLGRLDESLNALKAALALNPDLPEAHFETALVNIHEGEWQEAKLHIQQAIALAPDVGRYYLTAAACAGRLGDPQVALKYSKTAHAIFVETMAVNPEDSQALTGLGQALTQMGREEEALEAFQAALELDPNAYEAHYGAGWVYLYRKRRWREAEPHIQKAVALAPDVVHYRLAASDCAMKRRDFQSALQHLEAAHRIAPKALGKRGQWLLTYLQFYPIADKLFAPLIVFCMLTMPLYAFSLLMAGEKNGVGIGALPFGIASVVYLLERRYRLAVGSLLLGTMWVALVLFLFNWLATR